MSQEASMTKIFDRSDRISRCLPAAHCRAGTSIWTAGIGRDCVPVSAAELANFHWESRVAERHLRRYEAALEGEDEACELERVAITGALRGIWFVATCIVDGNGAVHDLSTLGLMRSRAHAQAQLAMAR